MSEICFSQRILRQADLMARMMERVGVDAAYAASKDGGLPWYEGRTKCIFCRNVQRCSQWLEGLEPFGTPTEFCPNTEFFGSCCSNAGV